MKKFYILAVVLLIICDLNGQEKGSQTTDNASWYNSGLSAMSAEDSLYLSNLPQLPVPEVYRGQDAPTLPTVVDNSLHPWFRPPFQQHGYSCGQAALIGYNFTYEINRARELSGNTSETQYPTHFTWNFYNAANYYGGVSYFHSIEVLREAGNPNCAYYGGMSGGGETRWMSGYDSYYHAMHNRINTAYQLKVNTEEGIQYLKHWIHDHLDGSETGGLASFYANQPYWPIMQPLPDGTPEEGKHVTLAWVSSSHALTIVGYHDSIRWDYNDDGQYTNHIDINNDGIVNVKDWEIGGLKFVNSYGGVPNWGDGGFCYMMYKTLADEYGSGGIWNNTVTLLDVKDDCEPQLTLKVYLQHESRQKIKIMAGMSTDSNATEPEHILEFPVFNYQGGYIYMQGGDDEEDKFIELGLDISSFLSHLENGQTARFFLMVEENDQNNSSYGEIISCSLMDYTSGLNEIEFDQSNVVLENNGLTSISKSHQVNYEKVQILNHSMPPVQQGELYSCQLVADKGEAPYRWDINYVYDENSTTSVFPDIDQYELDLPNNDESHVMQLLDFLFPFYGKEYDTVWINTDGTIQLQDDIFIWYYLTDDELLFPRNIHISPFLADLKLNYYQGNGIWYEGDENSAIFRWNASVNSSPGTDLNFAVELYPSGKIEFYYGTMNYDSGLEWRNGISRGTCVNYQYTGISGNPEIQENTKIELVRPDLPMELILTENGTYIGVPEQNYNGTEIPFKVTDNSFISSIKTLELSSEGILIDDELSSGNDNIPEAGEDAILTLIIHNYYSSDLEDAEVKIVIQDSCFHLTDSTENIGYLASGDSVRLENAFTFNIDPDTPDGTLINIETQIIDNTVTHYDNIFYRVKSPVLEMLEVVVDDGLNGQFDPGETVDLIIRFQNTGETGIADATFELSSVDPYITINNNQAMIDSIPPDSIAEVYFNTSSSENTPAGHVASFDIELTTLSGFSNFYNFNLNIGKIMEDFESAGFTSFPWGTDNNQMWNICNTHVFEQNFAARSGYIVHNEETELIIDINVLADGQLSFYKKVSSEDDPTYNDYDYLGFYVDDVEKGRWDGDSDWENVLVNIEEGIHRLKWVYHKDESVSSGYDAAFLDYITFPPSQVHIPFAGIQYRQYYQLSQTRRKLNRYIQHF